MLIGMFLWRLNIRIEIHSVDQDRDSREGRLIRFLDNDNNNNGYKLLQ